MKDKVRNKHIISCAYRPTSTHTLKWLGLCHEQEQQRVAFKKDACKIHQTKSLIITGTQS